MKYLIKVYNHKDAPEGSIYVESVIEKNGISDYTIKDYLIQNIFGKQVHFYYVIKK